MIFIAVSFVSMSAAFAIYMMLFFSTHGAQG
jgi:hypothetical protein